MTLTEMKILRLIPILCASAAALAVAVPAGSGVETRTIVDFEDGLPPETEERRFAGQTLYLVVELVGQADRPAVPVIVSDVSAMAF
jgi:hypothetical protein